MSPSIHSGAAMMFGSSRRGGLTPEEIREIEAHRARARPTPWSALARRYGRCEADIKAYFDLPAAKPEPLRPLEPVASPLSRALAEAATLSTDPKTAARIRALVSDLDKPR